MPTYPLYVAAVAGLLLTAACSTGATAGPTPSATVTTTVTATPSDTSQGTSPAGTNPNPAAPSPTALAVTPANGRTSLGQDITYSDGVVVHVGAPQSAPHSVVVVPVTVRNGSTQRLAGDQVLVTLLAGPKARLADLANDDAQGWNGGFPKVIAPGASATQDYAFAVTPAEAKTLEVQASPDGGIRYLMGLWAGGVSE
jgi:hypothetical protein